MKIRVSIHLSVEKPFNNSSSSVQTAAAKMQQCKARAPLQPRAGQGRAYGWDSCTAPVSGRAFLGMNQPALPCTELLQPRHSVGSQALYCSQRENDPAGLGKMRT